MTIEKSFINKIGIFILIAFGLFNFLIFSGNWGGDPEIHIVFARNFLSGGFLEFNLGLSTSGETSPIYMLLISLFSKIFDPGIVPFAMKFLGLSSLIIALIISTSPLNNDPNRKFIILYCLAIPSLTFQALLGMENILFAALYILYVAFAYKELKANELTFLKNILLFFCPLILFFLRPESIFLSFFIIIITLLNNQYKRALIYTINIPIFFVMLNLIEYYINAPLHGAGEVRALLSKNSSFVINIFNYELFVNSKPFYFILSTIGLIVISIPKFHKIRSHLKKVDIIPFLFIIIVPLSLHLFNFLPNAHFSRYMLYFFFTTVFLVSLIVKEKNVNLDKINNHLYLFLCASLIFLCEHSLRQTFDRSLDKEKATSIYNSQSKQEMKRISDHIIEKIKLDNTDSKITIAAQEVQIRLRLDDRFQVASLDGITDFKLYDFISKNGCFDHFGYLKYRNVDVLWEFPDYSRVHLNCGYNLNDLFSTLQQGQVVTQAGMIFNPVLIDGDLRAVITHLY